MHLHGIIRYALAAPSIDARVILGREQQLCGTTDAAVEQSTGLSRWPRSVRVERQRSNAPSANNPSRYAELLRVRIARDQQDDLNAAQPGAV